MKQDGKQDNPGRESAADLKEVKELVKSSGQAVAEMQENKDLVQKEINEEKERISAYVHETTTTCRSNNEDVLEKGETLKDLTEAHVDATQVRWAAHEEGANERVANHTRLAKEKMEDFKRMAVDGEEKLKASGGNLKKHVEEVKDIEEAAVRRLATEVQRHRLHNMLMITMLVIQMLKYKCTLWEFVAVMFTIILSLIHI